jgi:triacylglycerol esterase/lipase EstA (alpha/beta hydrolase family)
VDISQDHSSSCWPKDWLSKDVPTSHIRMLAVDYESRVSEWQVRSIPRNVIRRSMHDRAQEIAEQLKQAGVGKRPIIWVKKFSFIFIGILQLYISKVAHSMGGLLTKYILTNNENEELRSNTRACVFFSVPHFGAELGLLNILFF